MMHDLAITENHVILPLGPVVFDVSVMAEGAPFRQALSWQPERGFKFGIRTREAGSEIRWFDAPHTCGSAIPMFVCDERSSQRWKRSAARSPAIYWW